MTCLRSTRVECVIKGTRPLSCELSRVSRGHDLCQEDVEVKKQRGERKEGEARRHWREMDLRLVLSSAVDLNVLFSGTRLAWCLKARATILFYVLPGRSDAHSDLYVFHHAVRCHVLL